MSGHGEPTAVLVVAENAPMAARLLTAVETGGHPVLGIASAPAALGHLRGAGGHVAVVVVGLGRQASIDFLRRAHQIDPLLGAVVVVAGMPGGPESSGGLRGVTLLVDPFEEAELLEAVDGQVHRRGERAAEERRRRAAEYDFEARFAEVEERLERFAAASLDVLVTAFEARDPHFSGHSQRVAQLSASLADALGHSDEDIEAVRLAGRLHDIGMLWVSDLVVHKDGPLSPVERAQIQQHPVVGHHLLLPYAHLTEVGRFVRSHHERWDGAGYPDGLTRDQIPWGGRIIAVAEAYDAMITSRAHRRGVLGCSEATREIQRLAGAAFDPSVVQALAGLVGRRRTLEFVPEQVREVAHAAAIQITAA